MVMCRTLYILRLGYNAYGRFASTCVTGKFGDNSSISRVRVL